RFRLAVAGGPEPGPVDPALGGEPLGDRLGAALGERLVGRRIALRVGMAVDLDGRVGRDLLADRRGELSERLLGLRLDVRLAEVEQDVRLDVVGDLVVALDDLAGPGDVRLQGRGRNAHRRDADRRDRHRGDLYLRDAFALVITDARTVQRGPVKARAVERRAIERRPVHRGDVLALL